MIRFKVFLNDSRFEGVSRVGLPGCKSLCKQHFFVTSVQYLIEQKSFNDRCHIPNILEHFKKNRIRLYTKTSTDLCNKFKMQHVKQHLPATQIPGFKRLRKQTLQMFLAHGRFPCYRSQVWWSGFLLKTTIFEGHDLREFHIEERRTNSPIDSDSPQTAGICSCLISKKNVKQKSHFKESFSTISYLYLCHSANLYIYIHKSYIHINYICI